VLALQSFAWWLMLRYRNVFWLRVAEVVVVIMVMEDERCYNTRQSRWVVRWWCILCCCRVCCTL